MHRVMVYGTLQRGQPNHSLLDQPPGQYTHLGRVVTTTKWPLVIATSDNLPCLLDVPGCGNNIVGDLIAVDDAKLKLLDKLEGHPRFYTRVQINVQRIPNTAKSDGTVGGAVAVDDALTAGVAVTVGGAVTTSPETLDDDTEGPCWVYMIQNPQHDLLSKQMFASYDAEGDHGLRYVLPRDRTSHGADEEGLIGQVKCF